MTPAPAPAAPAGLTPAVTPAVKPAAELSSSTIASPGTGSPAATATVATITVRYFAAAATAAGVDEEAVPGVGPTTVRAVLDDAARRHGSQLATVLERCSFLLDEIVVHDAHTAVIRPGQAIDVLPPFAGG